MDECCQPQDSAELLLVHPLEGQTEEEFLDDWVDAFREFVAGAKDPDPSSEAANGDRRRPDSGAGGMNRICGANKSLPVTVLVSRLARRSTK